jgi:hypothetical protein
MTEPYKTYAMDVDCLWLAGRLGRGDPKAIPAGCRASAPSSRRYWLERFSAAEIRAMALAFRPEDEAGSRSRRRVPQTGHRDQRELNRCLVGEELKSAVAVCARKRRTSEPSGSTDRHNAKGETCRSICVTPTQGRRRK